MIFPLDEEESVFFIPPAVSKEKIASAEIIQLAKIIQPEIFKTKHKTICDLVCAIMNAIRTTVNFVSEFSVFLYLVENIGAYRNLIMDISKLEEILSHSNEVDILDDFIFEMYR